MLTIPRRSVIPPSPTYQSPDYGTMLNPIFLSHQPFMPMFPDPSCPLVPAVPNSPTLQPSLCDPMGYGFIPTFAMSHQMQQPAVANNTRPNNFSTATRKGFYNYNNRHPQTYPRQNLRRGIVIQNLNPATTDQDLYNLLQETVTVEHCEILPMYTSFNANPTRNRATARVTLRSSEEAKRAVTLYNNSSFMRFRIRVKIDKNIPPTLPYNLASDIYTPGHSDLSTSAYRATQFQFTPPTTESSGSDTDELSQSQEAAQDNATESSPKSKPKQLDSFRPLVVNGSGIGGSTAVVT